MSNPYIEINNQEGGPTKFDVNTIESSGGWGMMYQIVPINFAPANLTGLRTLIEPADYQFYVFLFNKTAKVDAALKKVGLLETYKQQLLLNKDFKSYMIEKLDPTRRVLNPKNNQIYMICIRMSDMNTLYVPSGSHELLSPELPQALSNITYGVLSGGKKSHKKKSKRKSKRKSRKSRKTRRYK